MTDLELFSCFNFFIGKKNNHFLWRNIRRKEEPLRPSELRKQRWQRVKRLRRFYTRYSHLEISPFQEMWTNEH